MVLRIYDLGTLAFRDATPILGSELRAIKLTEAQAAAFCPTAITFEELLEKYGRKNRLAESEFYNGYIVVYINTSRQHVVYLRGKIRKHTGKPEYLQSSAYREAAENGHLYDVVDPGNIEETYPDFYDGKVHYERYGLFRLIWNFNECDFNGTAIQMKQEHLLPGDVDTREIEVSLKRKIVDSLITKTPFKVTYDEHLVLKSYLGLKHYKEFFQEL